MLCLNCKRDVDPSNGVCPNCHFPLPGLDVHNVNQNSDNLSIDNNISNLSNMGDIEEFNRNFSLNNNELEKEEPRVFPDETPKKKQKHFPIFTLILILLVLGLSGYIGYDKLINNNHNVILKETTTKQYQLTEQEALGVGNYLWNYAFDTVWCKTFEYSEEASLISEGVSGFEITNYDQVIKNFTSDFIYEYNDASFTFNDIFDNHILDNKYYDVNKCNREANTTYHDTKLDIKLISKDNIVYKAVSTYCEGENCIDKKIEKEFEIVKEKKQWKIKKFYLPN